LRNSILVIGTMLLCVASFVVTLTLAKMLGFSPADLHDPAKALALPTMFTIVFLHGASLGIAIASHILLLRGDPRHLLGARNSWRMVLVGLFIGLLLKGTSTILTYLFSPNVTVSPSLTGVTFTDFTPHFIWYLTALTLNSLNEELIYRSFPISSFLNLKNDIFRPILVLVLTAVIFSLAHFLLEPWDLSRFCYRVAFGLLAGALFLRYSSLALIVAFHTGWNFAAVSFSDSSWQNGGIFNLQGIPGDLEIYTNCVALLFGFGFFYGWLPFRTRMVSVASKEAIV
jgi:membrane protease YdiL (CAAX protease family)